MFLKGAKDSLLRNRNYGDVRIGKEDIDKLRHEAITPQTFHTEISNHHHLVKH